MTQLHLIDDFNTSSDEWESAWAMGKEGILRLLDTLDVRVAEQGDEGDQYEALYLRLVGTPYVSNDKVVEIAERMSALFPTDVDYAYYAAERLLLTYRQPVLALAHVEQGILCLELVTDLGSRFGGTLRLKSLQLSLLAQLQPDSQTVKALQWELMGLLGFSRVLPAPLLIDALERLEASGNLEWASSGILNAIWQDLALAQRRGTEVDNELTKVMHLLSAVPPLPDMPAPGS